MNVTLQVMVKFNYPWLILWEYISKSMLYNQYFGHINLLFIYTVKLSLNVIVKFDGSSMILYRGDGGSTYISQCPMTNTLGYMVIFNAFML